MILQLLILFIGAAVVWALLDIASSLHEIAGRVDRWGPQ